MLFGWVRGQMVGESMAVLRMRCFHSTVTKNLTDLHWKGVKTTDDDARKGSMAMGVTRMIALAKMYTTPRLPQKLPKMAIVLVKGHFLLTFESAMPSWLSAEPEAEYKAVEGLAFLFAAVMVLPPAPPPPPRGIVTDGGERETTWCRGRSPDGEKAVVPIPAPVLPVGVVAREDMMG